LGFDSFSLFIRDKSLLSFCDDGHSLNKKDAENMKRLSVVDRWSVFVFYI